MPPIVSRLDRLATAIDAVEAEPPSVGEACVGAEIALELGLVPLALDLARRAAEAEPANTVAHVLTGFALLRSGMRSEARAARDRARQGVLPPESRALAGLLELAVGDPPEGEELLIEGTPDSPSPESAWRAADQILRRRGNPARARELLARTLAVVEMTPELVAAALRHDDDAVGVAQRIDSVLARPVGTWPAWQWAQLAFEIGSRSPGRLAEVWARHHAECVREAAHLAPVAWPWRTTGTALRVGVMVDPISLPAIERSALVARLTAASCQGVLLSFDPAAQPGPGPARAGGRLGSIELGRLTADGAARAIAELDLDLLVDANGVRRGELLAILVQRPAACLAAIDSALLGLGAAAGYDAVVTLTGAPAGPEAANDPGFGAAIRPASTPEPGNLTALARAVAARPAASIAAEDLAAQWRDAIALRNSGKSADALAACRSLLSVQPGFAPAWTLAAEIDAGAGRLDEARLGFARAIDLAPAFIEPRAALARLELGSGRAGAALAALGPSPPGPSVARARIANARAYALRALSRPAEAIVAAEEAACALPLDAGLWYDVAIAAREAGDGTVAERSLRRSLALSPGYPEAAFDYAALLHEQGRYTDAARFYERVINLRPATAIAYKQCAECLYAARKYDRWEAVLDRAEAAVPKSLATRVLGLQVWQYRGNWPRVEALLADIARADFTIADDREGVDLLEELLYLLLFFDVDPELVHRAYRRYDELARRVYGEPLPRPGPKASGGRLRVGYLSADVKEHVMGRMIAEIVAHHDTSGFEVILYRLNSTADARTADLARHVAMVRDLSAMRDRDAVEAIRADGLDVLVDLATHTAGARPAIVARRPARVVLTFVASAGALGLSAVDFKMSDRYCDPAGSEAYLVERLLRVEPGVYPILFSAPAGRPVGRASLGIAADAFVIGAFVNALKLSRRCLSLWARVLERNANAVLLFSPIDPEQSRFYLALAGAAGIGGHRIAFVGQGNTLAEGLDRYALVDVVLDTMPYGGVNGTLEALSAGVPVIALEGSRHAERTTASLLRRLGLSGWIADTPDRYLDLASRLAADLQARRSASAEVKAAVARYDAVQARGYVAGLERAYSDALAALADGGTPMAR